MKHSSETSRGLVRVLMVVLVAAAASSAAGTGPKVDPRRTLLPAYGPTPVVQLAITSDASMTHLIQARVEAPTDGPR